MANTSARPKDNDIPVTPDGYAKECGRVARFAAFKSGKRLAQGLRKVVAADK
jgi:hypothetical protein